MPIIQDIKKQLLELQDPTYRNFQQKLLPTISPDRIIGVRTPLLRSLAKQLYKTSDLTIFLNDVPHEYFDEAQLHAFIISEYKDFDQCLQEVCRFLPFIDNWATCDQLAPKVFHKYPAQLIEYIKQWIPSNHTYTVRFGIGKLMQHYLDKEFDLSYPETVASIRSDEYYVNMMIAWYFATALAKQYNQILPFIENQRLDKWTHNKAIQKAIESYRITNAQKKYLRSLKITK